MSPESEKPANNIDFSQPIRRTSQGPKLGESSQDQPALSENVFFVHRPQVTEDQTTLSLSADQPELVSMPSLPAAKNVLEFYKRVRPLVDLGSGRVTTNSTTSLNLDDLLGKVTVKDPNNFVSILTEALSFWTSIDRRNFSLPRQQPTNFDLLKSQELSANELRQTTERVLKSLSYSHTKPAQEVLTLFLSAIQYYRTSFGMSISSAAELAGLELVHDAGIKPTMQRPQMEMSGASTEISPRPVAKDKPPEKPRKVINYGRETQNIPNETNDANVDYEKSNTEAIASKAEKEALTAANRAEASKFEFDTQTNAWKEHYDQVRKPIKVFERYGPLTQKFRSDLERGPESIKMPDWVEHAALVSASNPHRSLLPVNPLQEIAGLVAAWSSKAINYLDNFPTKVTLSNFTLEILSQELEQIKIKFIIYDYVIRVVEGLAPTAIENEQYFSQLSPEHQKLVKMIAPVSQPIINSFTDSMPLSSAALANAERERTNQIAIELRAKEILRENDYTEVRYESDERKRVEIARKLARKEIESGISSKHLKQ